jgi:hypothetical protein
MSTGTFEFPGGTGADQLYGFWMLEGTGNRDISYLDPSVTPTSSQAPSATLLSTDGGTDTLFWTVTAQGLTQVAEKTGLTGMLTFTDPILEIAYPCTYNTTWSDAVSANYNPGIPVTRVGTINGIADGYGTLELPQAVITNVLRVKVRKEITDQSAIATVGRVSLTYYFFTELVPHPVLKLQTDSVVINNGAPAVTNTALWMYGDGQTGIDQLSFDDIRFLAYPNPASGPVNLQVHDAEAVSYVEVMDATGRLVLQQAVVGSQAGDIQDAFSVDGLRPGVYQVRLIGRDGVLGTRPIVVE